MNRKAKGKGFKMRSSHTGPFKQMGSSPAKAADASLVAASREAAMANVPHDETEQINLMYKGINEFNKAKSQATADIMGGVLKGAKKFSEGKGAIAGLIAKVKGLKEQKSADKAGMKEAGLDYSNKEERKAYIAEQKEAGEDRVSLFGGWDDGEEESATSKADIKNALLEILGGKKKITDDNEEVPQYFKPKSLVDYYRDKNKSDELTL